MPAPTNETSSREVLERLSKRDPDLAAVSPQDAQCHCEWNVLVLPKKMLADVRNFPEGCQLWHTDAPGLQRHELRAIAGQRIDPGEPAALKPCMSML